MIYDLERGIARSVSPRLWGAVVLEVGNTCVAPVICDTKKDKILYQPSFWHLGRLDRDEIVSLRNTLVASLLASGISRDISGHGTVGHVCACFKN